MGAQRPIAWRLWDTFKPPSGREARRTVLAFTGIVMVGRMGLLSLLSPGSAARINIVSQWEYGFAFLGLFVALFYTLDRRRVSMAGFITSVIGCGVYAVQSFDVWPVVTSAGYYALMSLILMAEGAVIWRLLHVHP